MGIFEVGKTGQLFAMSIKCKTNGNTPCYLTKPVPRLSFPRRRESIAKGIEPMRIYGYISLCLLIMTIQGCAKKTPYSTSPKSDIEKTNAVRRELGIREIKPDWQFYIHQFNMDKWKDHDYLSKTVQMTEDPNELLWETDEYYTGATWITANNGVAWEHVVIAYDYTARSHFITS